MGTGAALFDLRRRTGGLDGRAMAASLLRIVAAAAVMTAAVLAVGAFLGGDGGVGAAVHAGVATVAGVTVYLLASRLFGVRELLSFLPSRRRS